MKRADLQPGLFHRNLIVLLLASIAVFPAVLLSPPDLAEPGFWIGVAIWVFGVRLCVRWPFLGLNFDGDVLVIVGEGITRRVSKQDIERAEVAPTNGLITVKQLVIVRKGSASSIMTPVIDYSRAGRDVTYAVERVNNWLAKDLGPGSDSCE
jgi:hypothetical protein